MDRGGGASGHSGRPCARALLRVSSLRTTRLFLANCAREVSGPPRVTTAHPRVALDGRDSLEGHLAFDRVRRRASLRFSSKASARGALCADHASRHDDAQTVSNDAAIDAVRHPGAGPRGRPRIGPGCGRLHLRLCLRQGPPPSSRSPCTSATSARISTSTRARTWTSRLKFGATHASAPRPPRSRLRSPPLHLHRRGGLPQRRAVRRREAAPLRVPRLPPIRRVVPLRLYEGDNLLQRLTPSPPARRPDEFIASLRAGPTSSHAPARPGSRRRRPADPPTPPTPPSAGAVFDITSTVDGRRTSPPPLPQRRPRRRRGAICAVDRHRGRRPPTENPRGGG